MTPAEILNEINRLPIAQQKALRKQLLSGSESDSQQITQDKFDRILLEEGFLANLPGKTDEDDDFEPVEFTGKPISETIIEERR